MKPKNQPALVNTFLDGATSGAIGHLLIQEDTLYNTEGNEFLAIVRRAGPAGNSRIFIINSESYVKYHETYRQHKKTVLEAIQERDSINDDPMTKTVVTFIPMEIYGKSFDQHPLNEIETQGVIRYNRETADAHDSKIKSIEAHTHERASYEQEFADEELIEASNQIIFNCKKIANALQADLNEAQFQKQIANIEELVKAPQIMEQAIKDGGIDPNVLHRMLRTRKEVQDMIDKIEQHISIIMEIPGVSGATKAPAPPDA